MKLATATAITAFALLAGANGCQPNTALPDSGHLDDYLVYFEDTVTNTSGYKNSKEEVVIPPGKYHVCFTDTFRTYAIVMKSLKGPMVAIDRQENTLYEVHVFDNGPDYPSEGLFRISKNNRMGFADSATGRVVIAPQFGCAFPFEKGKAQVGLKCDTINDGEHYTWAADQWFYIDKQGKRLKDQ